ncbi:hypothetical protein LCGC14_1476480 [marine sediment metagenome]|uniref:Uncharacterized protein n=1 Tax=marine sediment metagenome TaxID=412755 RepID=A0A0F9MCI2_9ZZZZ
MGDAQARAAHTLALPLSPETWGAIRLPHPMSAKEWDQMQRTLAAWKPGLVAAEPQAAPAEARPGAAD